MHWTTLWQMNLNSDKYVALHCTRSNTPLLTQYYINDSSRSAYLLPLTAVDQHIYLGVTLHKTKSWSHHIHTITNKASRTLNFIKCTLSKCSSDVKLQRTVH